MNITDKMVERAAEALFVVQQDWDEPFSYHSEFTWQGLNKERPMEARKFHALAGSALTAALGDVKPLDQLSDVLDQITATQELTVRYSDGVWNAEVVEWIDLPPTSLGEVEDDDFLTAIRAAVANAREQR